VSIERQGVEVSMFWDECCKNSTDKLVARTLKVGQWIKVIVDLNDDGKDEEGNYTPSFIATLKIIEVQIEKRHEDGYEMVSLILKGNLNNRYSLHRIGLVLDANIKHKRYMRTKVIVKRIPVFEEVA
jgi:hypothetical protein